MADLLPLIKININTKKGKFLAFPFLCLLFISCSTKTYNNAAIFDPSKVVKIQTQIIEKDPETFINSYKSDSFPTGSFYIFEKKYLQSLVSYNIVDFLKVDDLLLLLLNNALISNYKDCTMLQLDNVYSSKISFDKGIVALKRKDESVDTYSLPYCAKITYKDVNLPYNFIVLYPYYVVYYDDSFYVCEISTGKVYFTAEITNKIRYLFSTFNYLTIIDKKNNIIFFDINARKYVNTITIKGCINDVKAIGNKLYFITNNKKFNILNIEYKDNRFELKEDFELDISNYRICHLASSTPAAMCDNKLVIKNGIIDLGSANLPLIPKFDLLEDNILLYQVSDKLYMVYIDKERYAETVIFNVAPLFACVKNNLLYFKDFDGLTKAFNMDSGELTHYDNIVEDCDKKIPIIDGSFVYNGKSFKFADIVKSDKNSRLYKRIIDNNTYFFKLEIEKKLINDIGSASSKAYIIKFIKDWLLAWQNKNFNEYIKFYNEDFRNKKHNYKMWIEDKKEKFSFYRNINIEIGPIKIENIRPDLYKVTFTQRFESANYSDFGLKTLILLGYTDKYRIISESWRQLKKPSLPVEERRIIY